MTSTAGDREAAGAERLTDRIAEAVTGCPDVASLAGGLLATYFAGRKVAGVAVRETEVAVAVVARYGTPIPEIAAQVRAAVEPLVPGLPVDVRIDDIDDIDDIDETTGPGEDPGTPE